MARRAAAPAPLALVLLAAAAAAVATTTTSRADADRPFVSNVLGSNMVLQRDPFIARLWGWTARPNTTVTVAMRASRITARSDAVTGRWEVLLPPQPAISRPTSISITSVDSSGAPAQSAVLENVLFGDVFLCGGQSNMQVRPWRPAGTRRAADGTAAGCAAHRPRPRARMRPASGGTHTEGLSCCR